MADVLGERFKSRTGVGFATPSGSSDSVTLLEASAARIVPARALPLSNHASFRGVAQPGRAPGSGPGGRRFKSSLPDHSFQRLEIRKASRGPRVYNLGFTLTCWGLRPNRESSPETPATRSPLPDISTLAQLTIRGCVPRPLFGKYFPCTFDTSHTRISPYSYHPLVVFLKGHPDKVKHVCLVCRLRLALRQRGQSRQS